IGLALHNFNDQNGQLPPTFGWRPKLPAGAAAVPGGAFGSGFFHLLPFIEQDNLFKASYVSRSYTYAYGGPAVDYKYVFPPGAGTKPPRPPGSQSTSTYTNDTTQPLYNYG